MNIAIIGNPKLNSSTISKLSEKLTASSNIVKVPIIADYTAEDRAIDAELVEGFERIDWADMVIAVPKCGLAFTHDITAELAYARYKKKTVFIYYG